MKLGVREMTLDDIEKIVDYFVNADPRFLKGMGVDKTKLPEKSQWIEKLRVECNKVYSGKEFYYIIWLLDDIAIGHSNINNIEFGRSAHMHLHLWNNNNRKGGLGLQFIKLSIPFYFKNFELEKLICVPYSKNIAPNRLLLKAGFEFVQTYETTPGWINFYQAVNQYELKKEQLKDLNKI